MGEQLQLPTLLNIIRKDDDTPETVAQAAVTDPAPQAAQAAPTVALRGGQLSTAEQARAAAEFAWRTARRNAKDLAKREGSLTNALLSGKPPSVLEQCQYAESREWVPAGHEGGIAEAGGVIYHAVIGRPGVAFGNSISAICARPLRFGIAFFLFTVFVVTLLVLLFA